MGLWARFKLIFKSKANKRLDAIERVDETLDYAYQQQLKQLQGVKSGIADLVTSKKRVQRQQTTLQEQATKLDAQARQALTGGDEALAEQILERKALIEAELNGVDKQVAELEQQQEALIANERKLRAKVESFRTRKETIKAQYSAAEAQVRISEAATGVGDSMAEVGAAMQRVVDKTENMRARANAFEELEKAGTFDDTMLIGAGGNEFDAQLAQLESGTVGDELARMKAELGIAPAVEAEATPEAVSITKEQQAG